MGQLREVGLRVSSCSKIAGRECCSSRWEGRAISFRRGSGSGGNSAKITKEDRGPKRNEMRGQNRHGLRNVAGRKGTAEGIQVSPLVEDS